MVQPLASHNGGNHFDSSRQLGAHHPSEPSSIELSDSKTTLPPVSPWVAGLAEAINRFENSVKDSHDNPALHPLIGERLSHLGEGYKELLGDYLSKSDAAGLQLVALAARTFNNLSLLKFPDSVGDVIDLNRTIRNNAIEFLWNHPDQRVRRNFAALVKHNLEKLGTVEKKALGPLPERSSVYFDYSISPQSLRTPNLLNELGKEVFIALFLNDQDFFGERIVDAISTSAEPKVTKFMDLLRAAGLTIEKHELHILTHLDSSNEQSVEVSSFDPTSCLDLDTNLTTDSCPGPLSLIPLNDLRTEIKILMPQSAQVEMVAPRLNAQPVDGVALTILKQDVFIYSLPSFVNTNGLASTHAAFVTDSGLHIFGPADGSVVIFSDWGYQETLREVFENGSKGLNEILGGVNGRGNLIACRLVLEAFKKLKKLNAKAVLPSLSKIKITPLEQPEKYTIGSKDDNMEIQFYDLRKVDKFFPVRVSAPGLGAMDFEVGLKVDTGQIEIRPKPS